MKICKSRTFFVLSSIEYGKLTYVAAENRFRQIFRFLSHVPKNVLKSGLDLQAAIRLSFKRQFYKSVFVIVHDVKVGSSQSTLF